MTNSIVGYTALLLHAHLPFVRQEQDDVTMEERWFYEAVLDTYLPLFETLDKLLDEDVDFALTLSVSPTLLAMMGDPLMQQRTRAHLASMVELAHKEVQRLQQDAAFADTARMYASRFMRLLDLYDRLRGDLIAKLRSLAASGCVELITCAATHAFLPLVKNDAALRAQLEAAVTEFRRHFGAPPAGIWLPECGYTPAVEPHLQALGLRYFVVDAHTVGASATKPPGSAPRLTPGGACAFAGDPESSTQVWSAEAGYPSDPDYREYYRDIGFDLGQEGGAEWDYIKPYVLQDGVRIHTGLKYFRITDRNADVKEPYQPAAAAQKAQQHAEHFLAARLQQVRLQAVKGEGEAAAGASEVPPIIVCPYDAELFGHWWFEGPQWLEAVLRGLDKRSSGLQGITLSDYLHRHPQVDAPAQLSTSSWGRGGYAEVWLQPESDWMYPLLHTAEDRMIGTASTYTHPEQLTQLKRCLLDQAAKELMLAQSSDWSFIIDAGTVTEYAVNRIHQHIRHFHEFLDGLDSLNGLEDPEVSSSDNSKLFSLLEHRKQETQSLLPLLTYTLYTTAPALHPMQLPGNFGKHHKLTSKLRILMLAWEYPPHIVGGLARAVCDLSRYLAAMGHSVHVITCQMSDSSPYEIMEGVHVYRALVLQSAERINFIDWVFQMNLAFVDALLALTERGLEFDLIHAHDWLVYYAAKEGKLITKLPLIATIHATEYGRNQGNLQTELQKRIHSLECKMMLEADQVIICSQSMVKEIHHLFPLAGPKIVQIPNGIEPPPILGHPSAQVSSQLIEALSELKGNRMICFLGRLVFEKGVHILIEAMNLVKARIPNIQLWIAGTGPAEDWLRELALALPHADSVRFLGFLGETDKPFFLQHAELCIVPSLYEPFGIVLLEAMANGTPVVVSNVGGLAEIITHGVNGCKVPPGDVRELANQIIDLLLDPAYRSTLAHTARELVFTDFNWSQIAVSTLACYHKAII